MGVGLCLLGLPGTAQDERPGGLIGRKGDNLSQTRSVGRSSQAYFQVTYLGERFPDILADGAKEGFKVPGGAKRYYAAEFMACVVGFNIKIWQESVLADIDLP